MKDRKYKKLLLSILLITIGILYVMFLAMDIFNINSNISSKTLKYTSIILCFIISILIGKDNLNKRDKALIQAGMFVTIFADLSLLIFDYYIMGIILFSLVQIIYYIRYRGYDYKGSIAKFFDIFLFTITIYFISNLFIKPIDFIFMMGLFYAICIMVSFIESIKAFKRKLYPWTNGYMIVLGMAFFILCDINVAIANLTKENYIHIYNISSSLIWLFYLPSQVLLALSGYR